MRYMVVIEKGLSSYGAFVPDLLRLPDQTLNTGAPPKGRRSAR